MPIAPFQTMSAESLAKELVKLARNVRLSALKRHKRGPKKPVPKRTKHTDHPHVSPARLLTRAKGKVTRRKGGELNAPPSRRRPPRRPGWGGGALAGRAVPLGI